MNYEVLYYLMNEKHSVVEIKRTDLKADAPMDEVYHWLSISAKSSIVERLEFVKMSEEIINDNKMNVRVFKNSELRFDELFGKFVLVDDLFILQNCTNKKLPESLNKIIKQYLTKA